MSKDLRVENLVKHYGSRAVVDNVDLEVKSGEIVGLLGPNGAGKTTTFGMVVGLVKPDQGTVHLNGLDITHFPMYQRAERGLGYLPQEPSVFRRLTVRENFMALLELVEDDPQRRQERCETLLDDFALEHIADSAGHSLSGGERRRVEIARSLIPNPDFLLLDEPFSGVDPIAIEEVQSMVKTLQNRGIGILVTDHNVRETLAITDRSYIINQGSILISGDAETLLNDPEARKVYLGSSISLDDQTVKDEVDA
ncbi:MAG: LPS export ABC transporter ATP-binding protein [bacterium]